ncbi:hypothetical protein N1851_020018 [Merluccius polli]|uniref:Uncharacterized protein n=1 Tax=Merluccius polli TaxID=89951 RepID=A0AA47MLJ2_MERPO|nr:hypothetical protein N1851_020018 [Merluccius polli]
MAYMEMLFFVFKSCQSLEDHLKTIEGNPQPYPLATGTSKAQTPSDHATQQHNNSQCLNDETPSTSSQCQNIESGPSVSTHRKDMCASIISKLLGSGVPNNVVLSTIENLEEFVGDLQSNIQCLKSAVIETLQTLTWPVFHSFAFTMPV